MVIQEYSSINASVFASAESDIVTGATLTNVLWPCYYQYLNEYNINASIEKDKHGYVTVTTGQ